MHALKNVMYHYSVEGHVTIVGSEKRCRGPCDVRAMSKFKRLNYVDWYFLRLPIAQVCGIAD